MRNTAFEGRRTMITGGLGFIGSNLARRLTELGAEVVLVDSLIPECGGLQFNIRGLEGKVRVSISDVRDSHNLRHLLHGQDYLFNLAGKTSHMDSMEAPHADLEINCDSQLSILESCRSSNPAIKVVFASTRQIYGVPDYVPVDETHPVRPVDVNGIHKMAAEHYHVLYNNVHGIRTSTLRLTNSIGPRMRIRDARQTFLGYWIRCLIEGKPIEVWEGNQLRDFTYVDDVVEALLLAASSEDANGRVFNLGGDSPIGLRHLAELLVEINGGGRYVVCPFPPEHKRIDIGDYYADFGLIRSVLGWEPKVPLRKGLSRTLAFYREFLPHYL